MDRGQRAKVSQDERDESRKSRGGRQGMGEEGAGEKEGRKSNFDFCNFGATSILPAIITE